MRACVCVTHHELGHPQPQTAVLGSAGHATKPAWLLTGVAMSVPNSTLLGPVTQIVAQERSFAFATYQSNQTQSCTCDVETLVDFRLLHVGAKLVQADVSQDISAISLQTSYVMTEQAW